MNVCACVYACVCAYVCMSVVFITNLTPTDCQVEHFHSHMTQTPLSIYSTLSDWKLGLTQTPEDPGVVWLYLLCHSAILNK